MSIDHTNPAAPQAPAAPAEPVDAQRAVIAEAAEANRAEIAAEAALREAPLDQSSAPPPETDTEALPGAQGDDQGEQKRRVKPSIAREERRRQAAARRHEAEAKAALAETQRLRVELERERAELREFEQTFRKDPVSALMQRTGMTREQVIAANIDGQASDIPPAVQHLLDENRREIAELKQSIADREKTATEQQQTATQQQRVQQDLDKIDSIVQGAVDEYPASASVPRPFRDAVARQAIELAVAEMTELNDFELYTHRDIIEAVEKRCEQHLGNIHESPYVKRRLSSVATSAPATQARPARGRQGLSARDAAAPAQARGPKTADEIRADQEAYLRDAMKA